MDKQIYSKVKINIKIQADLFIILRWSFGRLDYCQSFRCFPKKREIVFLPLSGVIKPNNIGLKQKIIYNLQDD